MKESSKLFVLFFFLCSLMFMGCSPIQKEKHTFSIGDKTFLLDGKPFLIKAAEMHYTRIPAEYWEHRIQMCKALGMNTIVFMLFGTYTNKKRASLILKGRMTLLHFAVWHRNMECTSCCVPVLMSVRSGKWADCLGGC